MPYSTNYFKTQTIDHILKHFSKDVRILDIGPGAGTYADLLRKHGYVNIDCIEACKEYVQLFDLKSKYSRVWVRDVTTVDQFFFEDYDLVILGDVYEHIERQQAKELIERIELSADFIIAVPFNSEQGASHNNTFEIHRQPDLTLERILLDVPSILPLCLRFDYGVFTSKTPDRIFIETEEKPLPFTYFELLKQHSIFLKMTHITYPKPEPPLELVKSDVTVVTGLWNMGRGELTPSFKRSYSDYLNRFAELLKADVAMYIFADKSDEDFIWMHRSKHNTVINFMSLQELQNWFAFSGKVDELRQKEEWLSQASWLRESPQANLPAYNPVVMSKMFMLNNVTIWNPFTSQYFYWIDAGITSTVHYGYFSHDKVFANLPNYCNRNGQFVFLSYPYEGGSEIHGFSREGMARYCNTDYVKYVCRGGFFGGSKDAINQVNGAYYQYLSNSLLEGEMGTEESIFTIVAHNHPELVHRFELEGNGLVWPFFEELKKYKEPVDLNRVALYVLTFNSPEQFETLCRSFIEYDPHFLTRTKRYLLNNSTNRDTDAEYDALCEEYVFEEIHKDNIGICGGRQFVAEHFAETDYDYCIFYEDDMFFYNGADTLCKNGFQRYVPNLFKRVVSIMNKEKYDFLKFNFTEFFGDNSTQWAWYNVPQNVRETLWPNNCKLPVHGQSKNAPRTTFKNIKNQDGLPYADGEIYYCNWPQIVSKQGNKKMFLDTKWEHPFEQTWMSYMYQETLKGNLKPALLLATPTEHNRFDFYKPEERREH